MSETATRIAWKDGGCTSCGKMRDGSHNGYCRACNSSKQAMAPEAFALRRGRLCW